MNLVNTNEMDKIRALLKDTKDTLILSAVQGHMGNIWCDDLENPKTIQIVTADFCYFIGEAKREFVRHIPNTYSNHIIVMVPMDESWSILIEREYEHHCKKIKRYAISKETQFDIEKLQQNIYELESCYEIKAIDEEIYKSLNSMEWSCDLCSQFSTFDDFNTKGIGYVITYGEEIVCGASSYTIFEKGIEIEIDTKLEHRRKKLALACASQLIVECLRREIYPSWDAANLASVSLSEKLGYVFDKEYDAYVIKLK